MLLGIRKGKGGKGGLSVGIFANDVGQIDEFGDKSPDLSSFGPERALIYSVYREEASSSFHVLQTSLVQQHQLEYLQL